MDHVPAYIYGKVTCKHRDTIPGESCNGKGLVYDAGMERCRMDEKKKGLS